MEIDAYELQNILDTAFSEGIQIFYIIITILSIAWPTLRAF